MDRMTKMLLMVIAIFLGILVFRPSTSILPPAAAQADSGNNGGEVRNINLTGWRTQFISSIPFLKDTPQPRVHIMDDAHAILLEYREHMMLYRLNEVNISLPRPTKAK